MNTTTSQLHPNKYFHIFNRGINGSPVFFDILLFTEYAKYVHPYVETTPIVS